MRAINEGTLSEEMGKVLDLVREAKKILLEEETKINGFKSRQRRERKNEVHGERTSWRSPSMSLRGRGGGRYPLGSHEVPSGS